MNKKRMMNFGKFLLAGVVALGMTACSSDEEATSPTPSKVNTYMTVSLTSSALQRTLDNNGNIDDTHTDGGLPEENTITKLMIILAKVSPEGSLSQNLTKKTLTSDELEAAVDNQPRQTKPFEISTGNYRIYVIVNPTTALTSKIDAVTTEAALRTLVTDANFTGYDATNNFTMTSAVNYDGDYSNIPTVQVKDENIISNPAESGNINVDRMAVKIRAHAKTTADNVTTATFADMNGTAFPTLRGGDNQIASIQIMGYNIVNKYTKANLFQQWTATKANDFVSQLKAPNYVATPSTTDYLNTKADYRTLTIDATNKVTGFSVIKDNVADGSEVTMQNLGTLIYTLESNPLYTYQFGTNDVTKREEEATGVLFQAQALDKDGKPLTFYTFNGLYYATPAAIQAEYPDVFKPLLAEGVEDTPANRLAAFTAATPSDVRAKCDVQVYSNGIMYYSYFIKDNNYFWEGNKTYYAVMRNTIYDLTVNSVTAIGTDIPFGWQPGEHNPIDKNNTYLQVSLTVNPWVLNTYNVNLK